MLHGDLEYGTNIQILKPEAELKGKIFFKEKGIPIPTRINHDLNRKVLGTYEFKYHAMMYFSNEPLKTVKTIVNIVDTKPPEIRLKEIKNRYLAPGEEYIEEGYTAEDNYDKIITDKVTSYREGNTIYYSVSDSSGNIGTAIRRIPYRDSEAPEITLMGDLIVYLQEGESFNEPGFTATDDTDGDITENIIVDSNLNIFIPGEYTITYSVEDSSGNIAKAERTIVINEIIFKEEYEDFDAIYVNPYIDNLINSSTENIENSKEDIEDSEEEVVSDELTVETEEVISENEDKKDVISDTTINKIIYLTFDDGPSRFTEELLDILKGNNVKATFFIVNTPYSDIITRIHEEGHAIGVHSYTHIYKDIYSSIDNYLNDFHKMQELIYEKTGEYTNIFRFPGGSSNTVSTNYCANIMTELTKEMDNQKYVYFDWNVSSRDAEGGKITKEDVYNNVITGIGTKEKVIVLQHDTKKFSIDAVQDIINWGKENGYVFLPLDVNSFTAHHKIQN